MTAHPSLDLVPGETRGGVPHEVRLTSVEFGDLPVVDGDRVRGRREVVPEISHVLEFFRRAQVEDRTDLGIHCGNDPGGSEKVVDAHPLRTYLNG